MCSPRVFSFSLRTLISRRSTWASDLRAFSWWTSLMARPHFGLHTACPRRCGTNEALHAGFLQVLGLGCFAERLMRSSPQPDDAALQSRPSSLPPLPALSACGLLQFGAQLGSSMEKRKPHTHGSEPHRFPVGA